MTSWPGGAQKAHCKGKALAKVAQAKANRDSERRKVRGL